MLEDLYAKTDLELTRPIVAEVNAPPDRLPITANGSKLAGVLSNVVAA